MKNIFSGGIIVLRKEYTSDVYLVEYIKFPLFHCSNKKTRAKSSCNDTDGIH